jgi:hypothetical protein
MWEIVGSPSQENTDAIRQVEDRIPAEDAAFIKRIEFFPGGSKDADFTAAGPGGAAYPWESDCVIVINSITNAGSRELLQGTLAHEIGHCIDWRDTQWEWHHWAPAPPLDALASELKDTFAEYFASGYAINHGYMRAQPTGATPCRRSRTRYARTFKAGRNRI